MDVFRGVRSTFSIKKAGKLEYGTNNKKSHEKPQTLEKVNTRRISEPYH